jgi:hypothetical protein
VGIQWTMGIEAALAAIGVLVALTYHLRKARRWSARGDGSGKIE